MKKILFTLTLLCIAGVFSLQAQIRTPQPSPSSTIKQTVGLSDITVEYSRPSMKGRKVYGELVPFGQMWRTGANSATKITFPDNVTIEGKAIEKGTYAIFSIPQKGSWTLIFNKNTAQLPGPGYDEKSEVARVEVKPVDLKNAVETFTIGFSNLGTNYAHLDIAWENTQVSVKIETEVDRQVMANIERVMAGPAAGDYYQAAIYYYETGRDLNQALEWINKAVAANERYWIVTWKARILTKMGEKAEAIKTAKMALELAKKDGNNDYVKINEEIIAANK